MHHTTTITHCAAVLTLVLGTARVARGHEPDPPRSIQLVFAGPEAGPTEPICRVNLSLVDAESGRAIPGIIRVTDGKGNRLPIPGLLPRGLGARPEVLETGWHVLVEPREIRLPARRVTIEALHGLETLVSHAELDMRGKETAHMSVPLQRFWKPRDTGLVAGNTHVHLQGIERDVADRYLVEVNKADGVGVVFVSYLERYKSDEAYTTNAYRPADFTMLSRSGVRFGWGEEYRHNFGPGGEGYGHVMFLGIPRLILPASIGPGISRYGTDAIPLRPGIELTRDDGATVVWCHNALGFEDIPSFLHGLVDAQNIFDGGKHGTYEESFYRYLNLGLRVPFSTGTDWFIYDFSRVYARVEGEATIENWLAALRAGRTFITNGPMLELSVGKALPGEILNIDQPEVFDVTARAIGRHGRMELELIQSGRVVSSAPADPESGLWESVLSHRLEINGPGWVAARVRSEALNELGHPVFAHTSPIYIDYRGERVFSESTARQAIAELRESIEKIDDSGSFVTDTDRRRIRGLYESAAATLEERLR